MQRHVDGMHACVLQLQPFFKAAIQDDWEKAANIHQSIVQGEIETDNLKQQIRLHLPKSLFMPIARTDLLELLTMQDKIARKAKHIAGLVLGRHMKIPTDIASRYLAFVESCIATSALAKKAIHELDELVEAGFRGREVKIVEEMVHELDQAERSTDEIQVEVRQLVFSLEKGLHPVDVVFLYKVIDWTGELADRAQQLGHRLEMLLAQ